MATKKKKYHVRIDREHCKGCELCVTVCPRSVLAISVAMNSRGQHVAETVAIDACIGCVQCADMCPDAAIEIDVEESEG